MKWNNKNSIVFCKTKDKFGGLSNMCAGFPIAVNDLTIKTSEALYQSLRFPDNPDIQKAIIEAKSPMTAKMICRENIKLGRKDWEDVKLQLMRWSLQAKLICNWKTFGDVLISTGNKEIVELSYKDNFWGAKPTGEYLEGYNALGQLLKELRNVYRKAELSDKVNLELKPAKVDNLLLMGKEIESIKYNRR